jgi:catechol 2,3-dioxygenase-like lactoylglutathione lyase family enzyme
MPVELNHTIIASRDALESATFLSEMMDLPAPVQLGHFQAVKTSNHVSLDFASTSDKIHGQHYAFLVTEEEFDKIFARIQERGLEFWADPRRSRPGEIATHHGRQCYFRDPSGHYLEILTRSYDE